MIGVEAKVELELKAQLDQFVADGLITNDERVAAKTHMATANTHSSWIWHFNHIHVSFLTDARKSGAERDTFQGPWLGMDPKEQASRAREFRPMGLERLSVAR